MVNTRKFAAWKTVVCLQICVVVELQVAVVKYMFVTEYIFCKEYTFLIHKLVVFVSDKHVYYK